MSSLSVSAKRLFGLLVVCWCVFGSSANAAHIIIRQIEENPETGETRLISQREITTYESPLASSESSSSSSSSTSLKQYHTDHTHSFFSDDSSSSSSPSSSFARMVSRLHSHRQQILGMLADFMNRFHTIENVDKNNMNDNNNNPAIENPQQRLEQYLSRVSFENRVSHPDLIRETGIQKLAHDHQMRMRNRFHRLGFTLRNNNMNNNHLNNDDADNMLVPTPRWSRPHRPYPTSPPPNNNHDNNDSEDIWTPTPSIGGDEDDSRSNTIWTPLPTTPSQSPSDSNNNNHHDFNLYQCHNDAIKLCPSEVSSFNKFEIYACLSSRYHELNNDCSRMIDSCPSLACSYDAKKFCMNELSSGMSGVIRCLKEHRAHLSDVCVNSVRQVHNKRHNHHHRHHDDNDHSENENSRDSSDTSYIEFNRHDHRHRHRHLLVDVLIGLSVFVVIFGGIALCARRMYKRRMLRNALMMNTSVNNPILYPRMTVASAPIQTNEMNGDYHRLPDGPEMGMTGYPASARA